MIDNGTIDGVTPPTRTTTKVIVRIAIEVDAKAYAAEYGDVFTPDTIDEARGYVAETATEATRAALAPFDYVKGVELVGGRQS